MDTHAREVARSLRVLPGPARRSMTRRLFLRWMLINTLAVLLFIALGVSFVHKVSGAPLVVAATTLAFAAAMSVYAGYLSWKADILLDGRPTGSREFRRRASTLVHNAKHVGFAERTCQILGLVGAGVGFYIISTAGEFSNANKAAQNIIDGLGQGLLATLTGVLASLVLSVEAHLLVHALEKD
jgi:hypothetical protein